MKRKVYRYQDGQWDERMNERMNERMDENERKDR